MGTPDSDLGTDEKILRKLNDDYIHSDPTAGTAKPCTPTPTSGATGSGGASRAR